MSFEHSIIAYVFFAICFNYQDDQQTAEPTRPTAKDMQTLSGELSISQELEDLVHYCNVAKKRRVGDFVWLSFLPPWQEKGSQKKLRVQCGTTLIGMTKKGAEVLAKNFEALENVREHSLTNLDASQIEQWMPANPGNRTMRACA